MRDVRRFNRALNGDAMLVTIQLDEGTNMEAGNQQETSVTELCYKSVNLFLEEFMNIEAILFWIQ